MHLSITPLKLSAIVEEIPSDEEAFKLADTLLDSTTSWKEGKTYHKQVKTYSRAKGPEDGAAWHCRASIHKADEATFAQMWSKLGENKAENEMKFIPNIKKVTHVKELSPTQNIWTLYYTFPPPVAPRVFTTVQMTRLSDVFPRNGIIVSMAVDLSDDQDLAKLEEKGVKGRYVSVERLTELEDGNVEWRMATSSTPGGSIPTYFVERSLPSQIAEDVPHFMKWLHSLPKEE
ncbi:DUF3074 domain-containing protein [Favolaschia claudopus]|uniref:DUF3074 domain-containing protein n=1 Tax=Favolaschia claudopus TaxID=2862362 RepID=A0AAW0B551_9AGAR